MLCKIIGHNNSDVCKSGCYKNQITCREWDYCSSPYSIRKNIRGHGVAFHILAPCPYLNKEALLKKPKLVSY